jgi:hypothetical protein
LGVDFLSVAQPSFKTKIRHRRLGHILRFERQRPPGLRAQPVKVVLDVETGATPSPLPPVRIFVGTEPAQHRAERVFVWSIKQVRDPSRVYEIYLMKDLAGFNRKGWKTGFTAYRYAIPDLAGGSGRAIYNDVDQIYFADPAELFDMDMKGCGVMCITERETSVMLLDCERMANFWHREDAERGERHKVFRAKMHSVDGLWGRLPGEWNARDYEYQPGASKLLHFTTLQTQPWQPFPKELHYREHADARLWHDMERAADAAGFTLVGESAPSERYRELIDLYRTMHDEGAKQVGKPPEKTFRGRSLRPHIARIGDLVRETKAATLLDFGAGKAILYDDLPGDPPGSRSKSMKSWGDARVTCYDPGYEPFSGPIEDKYDGVICTDVLEHIPEEDIPWVLDKLFRHARSFVYAVAACYPARKALPNGENAHCTLQGSEWWHGQLDAASRRNPGVRWTLCTQHKGPLGKYSRYPRIFRG